MSTSGSTDFSVNRDDIIKRALRLIGALAQGETPTSDQTAEAAVALNSLVKAWQADGMPLWALKKYSVPLTADTVSYRIGVGQTINTPKPLRIVQAYNHDTVSEVDIPMRIITKQEYNILGNKTSSGNPMFQHLRRKQIILLQLFTNARLKILMLLQIPQIFLKNGMML